MQKFSAAGGALDATGYRSGCAEFDLRAVRGVVHSSDVELGAPRASTRRMTGIQ